MYASPRPYGAVASIGDTMDQPTNCEPWTVRQLASHAINSQLLWVGALTGQELVSVGDVMKATPYDDDLQPRLADAAAQARAAWGADGALDTVHATPFGELPGSAVIGFPTIDAFAHAWDLRVSVGHDAAFAHELIQPFAATVAATSNETTQGMGLYAPPAPPPADASATEALMASAGRSISR